jgi:deazaflavin-dependent oxidoreductase (nitroreductase family)
MKGPFIRWLQKNFFNRAIKLLFALGWVPQGYALLETIGRKTGKARRTPVGDGRVGREFWIVAEHGRGSSYIRNIANQPRVRVKVRHEGRMRWFAGAAHLVTDDDPIARQKWLAEKLPGSTRNAAAVRLFGTELMTVRIDLDDA